MVALDGHITYFGQRGTRVLGPAGTVGVGTFVVQDFRRLRVRPTDVGKAFIKVLQSSLSHWPTKGITGNYGPWSLNHSVRYFRVIQARDELGRFGRITLINTALNEKARAYAGYVVQGLTWGGRRVSPARYRANFNCIVRTWLERAGEIAITADRRRNGS